MRTSELAARRVFVDTGAFAALAVARDVNHRRALAISEALQRDRRRLLTTNFVASETHALVLSRAGRDAARRMLRRIDDGVEVIRVDGADERNGRAILDRYADKDFSLVDATSFAVMDRLGVRLAFTFDRHFAQYGLTVVEPG